MKKWFLCSSFLLILLGLAAVLQNSHNPLKGRGLASDFIPEKPYSMFSKSPSFVDDFIGQTKNDRSECFDRAPSCLIAYNGHWDCDQKYQNLPGLKHLNKCNWAIELFSIRNFSIARAENVVVNPSEDTDGGKGALYLYSTKNPNFTADFSEKKFSTTNCGNSIVPNNPYAQGYSDDCPYYVGHLWGKPRTPSKYYQGIPGFAQRFGRFEVRAKLQNNTINFPAFWLVPADTDEITANWPQDGEIDIMEQFAPDEIGGSYHGGSEKSSKSNHHANITLKYKRNAAFFNNNWHTYAVEWIPGEIRFFVDDENYGTIKTGSSYIRDGLATKEKFFNLPGTQGIDTGLPWNPRVLPYFWRLNTEVFDDLINNTKKYEEFKDSAVVIDYVKTYSLCVEQNDFCPEGGAYNNSPGLERCVLASFTKGTEVKIEENQLLSFDEKTCNASKETPPCVLYSYKGSEKLFIEDDHLKVMPKCADYRNREKGFSAKGSSQEAFDPYADSPTVLRRFPVPYIHGTVGGLKIEFNVPRTMKIRFLLYDMLGRHIGSLPEKDWNIYDPGIYVEGWNISGLYALTSGAYAFTMQWKEGDMPIMQTPAMENALGKITVFKN